MEKTLKQKAIDSLDYKILTELQSNARITNAEIGRRVGLSALLLASAFSSSKIMDTSMAIVLY